ncbi:Hsp70 family protein [Streptomyces sp. URMC 129]|uniref:Hsp70 family protein n=1 Tax=Streptomyces sp. URMC 129 TaxID=3423407 RepID=UPI003F1A2449
MPTEPTLVVDFGTCTSSAALVAGGEVTLLREPVSGSWSWPSAVALDGGTLLVGTAADSRRRIDPAAYRHEFKRELGQSDPLWLGERRHHVTDLVAAVLRAFRAAAEPFTAAPVDRLVLTVPATYAVGDPRRDRMLAAGTDAGFAEVELLPEPVAAALAPLAGGPLAPGTTALVYDFGGGTFDAALVRTGPDGDITVLGRPAALDDHGGRDIDDLIAAHIRRSGAAVFPGSAGSPGSSGAPDERTALQTNLALADFARQIKHHLTGDTEARDVIAPGAPEYRLSRERLAELITPLVAGTVACCRDLATACGVRPADIDAVVLVGGTAQMPVVTDAVTRQLGRPLRRAMDPALAVVQGAAAWARERDRRVQPTTATSTAVPLSWTLPDGSATVVRWLVEPGGHYRPDAPLLVVRTADTTLRHLHAPALAGGVLRARHAAPGARVMSGDWLATVAPPPAPVPALAVRPLDEPKLIQVHNLSSRVLRVMFGQGLNPLAAAPESGPVRLYDAVTATFDRVVTPPGTARTVALSADGRWLATAGDDGVVRLHDPAAEYRVRHSLPHPAPVWVMRFSPDGELLMTMGDDNAVRIIRTETGTTERVLDFPGPLWALDLSRDGWLLGTASQDRAVRFHHLVTGREWEFRLDWNAYRLALAPDATTVAVDTSVASPAGGADEPAKPGKWLHKLADATSASRFRLEIRDCASGRTLASHLHEREFFRLDFSPDGRYLAAATAQTVRVLDTARGTWRTLTQAAPVRYAAFSPDGRYLATGTGTSDGRGDVCVWSFAEFA